MFFIKRWCRRVKTVVKTVVLVHALASGAAYTSNKLIEPKGKTAVFSNTGECNAKGEELQFGGGWTYIGDFFMYPVITINENLRGNKVEWYTNPTKTKILKKLREENIDNVIFMGHGSSGDYCASDKNISALEIWYNGAFRDELKKDRVVQYTCGGTSLFTFCDFLAKDKKGCSNFESENIVWPHRFYIKTLKEIFE